MRPRPTRRTPSKRHLLETLEPRLLLSMTPSITQVALYFTSDSGFSSADHITSFNNSSPSRALVFAISDAAPGATLTLYDNGSLLDSGPQALSGAVVGIRTTSVAALPDGVQIFTVRQQLPGQDLSDPSTAVVVTIDTVAPAQPPAPVLNPGADPSQSLPFTTLTLTTSAGPYYFAYIDGVRQSRTYAAGQPFQPAIDYHNHTFAVAAADAAGNVSATSASLSVNEDVSSGEGFPVAPLLLTDSGISSSDTITNDATPTLSINTGGQPFYRVYETDTSTSLISGLYETSPTFTLPHLADGVHSFHIFTVNADGYTSQAGDSLTITVDTTPPPLAGIRDQSFADNSRIALASFGSVFVNHPLASGKILVGGSLTASVHAAIARLNADGTLDTSFANNGILQLAATGEVTSISQQSSGNFVLCFRAGGNFAFARVTSAGALDTSFAAAGYFMSANGADNAIVLPNDDILATLPQNIIRLTPSGALDPTFGQNGLVSSSILSHYSVNEFAVDSHGRILIATTGVESFGILRLTAAGALDTSFGTNGFFTLTSQQPQSIVSAYDVLVDSSDRVLVAGCLNPADTTRNTATILRLTSSGQLDPTFGNGGAAVLPGYFTYQIAATPDGYLVTDGNHNLYRILPNGTLDATFTAGDTIPLLEHNYYTFTPFALIADGSLLIASVSPAGTDIHLNRLTTGPSQLPPFVLTTATDTGILGDNMTTNVTPSIVLPPLPGLYYRVTSANNTSLAANFAGGNLALGNLTRGVHTFRVQFVDAAGNLSFAESSFAVIVNPPQAATTMSLAAPTGSHIGLQPVSLVATVTASSGFDTPTGTVMFLDGGKYLGIASLNRAIARFTVPAPAAGVHQYQAILIASPAFKSSTSLSAQYTAAPDHPAYGLVDIRSASLIGGMALDTDSPGATYVRIDIDNKPTTVVATNPTTHRFSYSPTHLALGMHSIKVFVYNYPTPTLALVALFTVANRPATFALHSFNLTTLTGIATDRDSPAGAVLLVLQIDKLPAVILTADHTLAGLPALHAFTYTLPTLSHGTHHLTLMAVDTSGAGITQQQTFTFTA